MTTINKHFLPSGAWTIVRPNEKYSSLLDLPIELWQVVLSYMEVPTAFNLFKCVAFGNHPMQHVKWGIKKEIQYQYFSKQRLEDGWQDVVNIPKLITQLAKANVSLMFGESYHEALKNVEKAIKNTYRVWEFALKKKCIFIQDDTIRSYNEFTALVNSDNIYLGGVFHDHAQSIAKFRDDESLLRYLGSQQSLDYNILQAFVLYRLYNLVGDEPDTQTALMALLDREIYLEGKIGGWTLLHFVAWDASKFCQSSIEVIRLLVEGGCDINAKDFEGYTPLAHAIGLGLGYCAASGLDYRAAQDIAWVQIILSQFLRSGADPSLPVSNQSQKSILDTTLDELRKVENDGFYQAVYDLLSSYAQHAITTDADVEMTLAGEE